VEAFGTYVLWRAKSQLVQRYIMYRFVLFLLLALVTFVAAQRHEGYGHSGPQIRSDRHPHAIPSREETSHLAELEKRQQACNVDLDCNANPGEVRKCASTVNFFAHSSLIACRRIKGCGGTCWYQYTSTAICDCSSHRHFGVCARNFLQVAGVVPFLMPKTAGIQQVTIVTGSKSPRYAQRC
jgi:hypothetical protein